MGPTFFSSWHFQSVFWSRVLCSLCCVSQSSSARFFRHTVVIPQARSRHSDHGAIVWSTDRRSHIHQWFSKWSLHVGSPSSLRTCQKCTLSDLQNQKLWEWCLPLCFNKRPPPLPTHPHQRGSNTYSDVEDAGQYFRFTEQVSPQAVPISEKTLAKTVAMQNINLYISG